ncbi:hypothetical protein [Cellulomonas sp. KRMCY2]|uniref:hypothetical protein n=1 Tax=Cellulomonas sp. KRMCY2 TaxID=1304865 RepID=UPI00045E5BC0|nr:hypothetical protein [Cellulomonas sp. KRMCY2]
MKKLVAATVVVTVVVLGLVAFLLTRGDEPSTPDPSGAAGPTGSATPEAEPEDWTRAEIAQALFTGDVGTTEVLGSATGAVRDPAHPFPASIEVTDVHAGQASTVVRFTLTNVDDSDPLISLFAFNSLSPLTRDVRDVALVVPQEDARLQPFLAVPVDPDKDGSFCTCSAAPLQMSREGQLLSATFLPLGEGTTTVSLEVPGFPLVENLPVTRD